MKTIKIMSVLMLSAVLTACGGGVGTGIPLDRHHRSGDASDTHPTPCAHRADTGEKHSVSLVYESVVTAMVDNGPRTHHYDMSFYSACVLWTEL